MHEDYCNIKRVPGEIECYILVFLISWMTTFLFVDAQVGLGCAEVTYLEVGREGVVSCSSEIFYAVSWYTKEDYDAIKDPLIHFNGNKHGLTAEYDVNPNGSFIIRNVTLKHSGRYIVTMLRDVTSNLIVDEVRVEVYVIPYPPYPVVEGRILQQHVYMDVNRDGELSCSMRGVYPNVSLTWTVHDPSQSNKIQFQHDVMGQTENEDETYDIILSSMFQVTDPSIRRLTIQCGVANEIGEYLSAKTKVDLLFFAVYPVVNGHVNQKHVYLDVEREGYLTCMKENVDVGTRLVWELPDPSMRDKITFQGNTVISNNNDGTVNINQTFDYEVNDNSLERVTVDCKVMKPDTDPLATRVDLLFQDVYPVVNGHVNQKHVYLDVEREGYLTCMKEKVDVGTRLVWEFLDPSMRDRITFQSNTVISNNTDGTVNINQTFDYEVNDNSLERVTVKCKVMEPDTDPLATRVDLLFQDVYPVVNGRVNQNHVHLDVDREGHLTCWKENVDVGTRLVWQVLDSTMRDKITFHSNQVISNNNDGTININQTFDYVVHDKSLERIAIECGVVEPNTAEHPYVTRVELLFGEVPTINGCYHQLDHCVLEVEMTGELTCTVRNSYQLVDLKWTTLGRDQMYVVFEESKVNFRNYTDFFDISVTTPYTVIDESVTSVNVRCDACRFDSGEVLSSAKTSLLIQTASDSNYNCKFCHFGIWLSTLLLIIVLEHTVIILWFCNRKMYKKSEAKYRRLLLSRPGNECGYPIPEAIIDEKPPCTAGGLPLRSPCDVCATDVPEGPEKNESTDLPDSGNSGSLASEQSGSEPSEKYGLMEDVEMSYMHSKQGSLDDKREYSEGDPMM